MLAKIHILLYWRVELISYSLLTHSKITTTVEMRLPTTMRWMDIDWIMWQNTPIHLCLVWAFHNLCTCFHLWETQVVGFWLFSPRIRLCSVQTSKVDNGTTFTKLPPWGISAPWNLSHLSCLRKSLFLGAHDTNDASFFLGNFSPLQFVSVELHGKLPFPWCLWHKNCFHTNPCQGTRQTHS
jgi:hypothetical protein